MCYLVAKKKKSRYEKTAQQRPRKFKSLRALASRDIPNESDWLIFARAFSSFVMSQRKVLTRKTKFARFGRVLANREKFVKLLDLESTFSTLKEQGKKNGKPNFSCFLNHKCIFSKLFCVHTSHMRFFIIFSLPTRKRLKTSLAVHV